MNITKFQLLPLFLFLLLFLILLPSCGTLISLGEKEHGLIYCGIYQDFDWMTSYPDTPMPVFAAIDLPLSFVADTLLLPYTIPQGLMIEDRRPSYEKD
jgi:uncharacterized protein YceK